MRTHVSEYVVVKGAEFERRIQKLARCRKAACQFMADKGKGSYGRLYLGEEYTSLKDRKKEILALDYASAAAWKPNQSRDDPCFLMTSSSISPRDLLVPRILSMAAWKTPKASNCSRVNPWDPIVWAIGRNSSPHLWIICCFSRVMARGMTFPLARRGLAFVGRHRPALDCLMPAQSFRSTTSSRACPITLRIVSRASSIGMSQGSWAGHAGFSPRSRSLQVWHSSSCVNLEICRTNCAIFS